MVFATAAEGGRLEAVDEAKLYTLGISPFAGRPGPPRPSRGKAILPTDARGRYRLYADGHWSGLLDLDVDDRGA